MTQIQTESQKILAAYMKEIKSDNEQQSKRLLANEAISLSQKIQRMYRPPTWTHKQHILLRHLQLNKMLGENILDPLIKAAEMQDNLRVFEAHESEKDGTAVDKGKGPNKRARAELEKDKEVPEEDALSKWSDPKMITDEKFLNSEQIKLDGYVPRRKILEFAMYLLVSRSPMKEIFNVFDKEVHEDVFRTAHLVLAAAMKIDSRKHLKPQEAEKILSPKEYQVLDIYMGALKRAERATVMEELNAFIRWMRPKLGVDHEML